MRRLFFGLNSSRLVMKLQCQRISWGKSLGPVKVAGKESLKDARARIVTVFLAKEHQGREAFRSKYRQAVHYDF
ncbi:hypothetical protein D3C74_459040 [compost metagenome]